MAKFTLPVLLCLAACAAPLAQRPARAEPDASAPLALLNGEPIARADLGPEVLSELKDQENEALQRQLHLLWAGVEELVGQKLLAAEAARRGQSLEELRRAAILDQVADPSADEVRRVYDTNSSVINVSFDIAAPVIREQMRKEHIARREDQLVAELKNSARVEYALTVPDLPRYDVSPGEAPARGRRDARVTLVAFADYECPYCAQAEKLVEELRLAYPDDLRIVYRHFPLRQHPRARPAAEAAYCAHEQGRFWEFHALVFENTHNLQADDLKHYAKGAALDLGKYEECLASERPGRAVGDDLRAGEQYGVRGTPAIFINGIKLIGLLPMPLLRAIIDKELGK